MTTSLGLFRTILVVKLARAPILWKSSVKSVKRSMPDSGCYDAEDDPKDAFELCWKSRRNGAGDYAHQWICCAIRGVILGRLLDLRELPFLVRVVENRVLWEKGQT